MSGLLILIEEATTVPDLVVPAMDTHRPERSAALVILSDLVKLVDEFQLIVTALLEAVRSFIDEESTEVTEPVVPPAKRIPAPTGCVLLSLAGEVRVAL